MTTKALIPTKVVGKDLLKDPKRVKWVVTRVEELSKIVNSAYVELTELLYEVYEHKYYADEGFDTFEDFVRDHLGWQERKGQYFVQIFRKLVVTAGLKKADLKEIPWTKAGRLSMLPDEELKKHGERWVKEASTDSVLTLEAKVKKVRDESQGKKSSGEVFVGKSFYLAPAQLKNVDLALKVVQKITGSDKQGHNLDMMALEVLTNRAEESDVKLNWILDSVCRVFGIEIVAIRATGGKEEIVYGAKLAKKHGIE